MDIAKTVTAIALLLLAAWYGLVKKAPGAGENRFGHWREAAVGESATRHAVVAISLIAIALEVPTMFPYLAAIRGAASVDHYPLRHPVRPVEEVIGRGLVGGPPPRLFRNDVTASPARP